MAEQAEHPQEVDAIRRDLEATRVEMGHTVDEIAGTAVVLGRRRRERARRAAQARPAPGGAPVALAGLAPTVLALRSRTTRTRNRSTAR